MNRHAFRISIYNRKGIYKKAQKKYLRTLGQVY